MFKLLPLIFKRFSSNIIKQSSNVTQISHTEKLSILKHITQKMKLKLKPSILISDEATPRKKLTNEQKKQLGLFIPKSPFNARLSRALQQQYLSKVTNELYHNQKDSLQAQIRILQDNLFLQTSKTTLDHYVNLIYKDIYARYLISKGAGVQWAGYFANNGVVNGNRTSQYNSLEKFSENYSILLDFIQNNAQIIQESNTIGLYSYYQLKFIHPSVAGVEKIKRMGYYIKQELTSYGKYANQFNVLIQKDCKVYILVVVDKLEKLINPNAICINEEDKYIMLKKNISENDENFQYLVVSHGAFKQHQKFFKDNKYERHNKFDGKHLLGMKCKDMPIISEIQGYYRPPNAYIVNSHCHIGDFQRVQAHNLPHFPSFIDKGGEISFKRTENLIMLQSKKIDEKFKKLQKEDKVYDDSYVIVDEDLSFHLMDSYKIQKSLHKVLVQEGVKFMDFYEVLDDEIYFHEKTKQILHWRMGEKYYIQIPQQNTQQILNGLAKEKTIISESKIKIQSINTGKKPRQKRQFRKQRKQKLKQITQHFNLAESLSQINNISISSLSQNTFLVPIFMKKSKIISYQSVLNQQQIQFLLEGKLKQINIKDKLSDQLQCRVIYANEQLLKALIYLRNLHRSKEIHNVIIEPQSETQQLVPNAIHLNYLINKSKARGRKFRQEVKNNISLIKLHPTLSEDIQKLEIQDLIQGVIKSNEKQQYGFGLQAIRLWTAGNDNYLGDRSIKDEDINRQLQNSHNIRTIFWNLISILPDQIQEVKPELYISNFMLDLIDCYIANMEECYKTLNIHQAYRLTNDFFTNILNEVYVKSIKDRVIIYPNLQENQEHFYVIKRILELVAVISPLFPFTAFHISKKADLVWPEILNPKFYEAIPVHTEMLKTRVKVVNKLRLNKLQYAQIYCESLKQSYSAHDLQLFFNVKKVSFRKPDIDEKACSVKLSKSNSITDGQKLIIYSSDDYCLRCEPKSKQTQHLCGSCISYLEEQVSQPLVYFRQKETRRIE